VVLQFQRAAFRERPRLGAPHMSALSFQWSVVLHEDAVAEHGEITGVHDPPVPVNGTTKNYVHLLELTGRAQRVSERRVGAVDGIGETVRIGRVLVVVQDLHLDEAHQENTAVASALAIALNLARRSPFNMQLAVAEPRLGSDVT